jgi:hypothetical protein
MPVAVAILTLLRAYEEVRHFFRQLCEEKVPLCKVTRMILSDEYDNDDIDDLDIVPEDAIVIDEYLRKGARKCVLHYEGEILRAPVDYNPFDAVPFKPWIWIGDKSTEVDLTHAMEKYLVPGNLIRIDLFLKLIQPREDTDIVFIDARTFQEVKFPANGVKIDAFDYSK